MDEEIEPPQMYIFQNVTIQVRNFVKTSQYQWIPIEKNGMLYYMWEFHQLRRSKQLVKWLKSWKISLLKHIFCAIGI